jgi:uncharacterized membrane protein YqiK
MSSLLNLLAICQPNQALVIYGLPGRRGYRLLKGGSTLLVPLLEDVRSLELGNHNIPIQIVEALTATGIRISVDAVANVKIASHEPVVHAAVERLLGPLLRGEAGPDDPLQVLRAGMERLAVRDADRELAGRITALAASQ